MNQRVAHAFMAVLILSLGVAAQVRSPGFVGVPQRSVTLSFGSQPQLPNPFFHQTVFLGGPMLYPDYYQPTLVPPPPQVVVVQVPSAPVETKDELRSVHPLLIEWQDDRFVRVTTAERTPRNRPMTPNYAAGFDTRSNSPTPAQELPPALLIFRDGHCEETANYAIVDGVLYAYPDYWTGGAWGKRILISDLDLPATFQQNQQRGVKFVLPVGPNQVVTRP